MSRKNIISKITDECDKILEFHMWYNYPNSIFWPLIHLMDIDNEDFLIEVYSSVSDNHMSVLTENLVIIPIIESMQSTNLLNYIKSIKSKKSSIIDDTLIFDIESALFINYEEPKNKLKSQQFEKIYMHLKRLTKENYNQLQDDGEIIKTLNSIINFSRENKHEYFSYINAYWLSFYFYKSIPKLKNRGEEKNYKDTLSELFPNILF
ncbi:hypothetical protein ACP179_14695 [Xenorhabdus stockiae]|uniref:hypothetical protein n=1 Tax=Xenorhabdus stockiae TaxID=351614 RepID=UPI003CF1F3B4